VRLETYGSNTTHASDVNRNTLRISDGRHNRPRSSWREELRKVGVQVEHALRKARVAGSSNIVFLGNNDASEKDAGGNKGEEDTVGHDV
jgi:hypothetical protein